MVRKMESKQKALSQASKTKMEWIESLIGRNKFAQALEEIRGLESREKIEKFSTQWGDLCYFSAVALHGLGDYNQAEGKAKSAYELLKDTSENRRVAQIQYVLGLIYSDLGDLKNAENHLRDAITTYRRIGDQAETVKCYNKIARIFFMRSEFEKAVEYLDETKELSKKTDNSKMAAIACRNLGRIYTLTGRWEKAEQNLLYGLESAERDDDELNLCRAQLSLGFVCCLMRKFRRASEYLASAFKLAHKNGYSRELAIYHEYMGGLCFDSGDYKEAENHYNQILGMWKTTAPEGDMIAQTYRLLAELQVAKKEYDQALASCRKSLGVSESLGEKIEEGAVYRILGQVYSARKDKELAKEYFNRGFACLSQIGAKYELAKTYLEAGRSKEFDYYKRLGFLSNAEIEFRGLGSSYHLGEVSLSIANLLAEEKQYDKAQLFLADAEELFGETKEQKALCAVRDLRHTVEDAMFQANKMAKSNGRITFTNIITQTDELREIIEKLRQIKDYDISILLEGDTGTGKDLFAKAVHYSSRRKDRRFIAVSCAALPEGLLENELFGHKKGAYTGADRDESGLFEEAEGGTLYLDEIAEVPLSTQVKLLRAIEEKEIVRLGETTPRRINVRIISSTSRELKESIHDGSFRQDLYYRLNTFHVKIPPLKQRKSDIPILVRHFLREYGIKDGDLEDFDLKTVVKGFSEYGWPGNVRELENELKRMVVLFQGGNGDPTRLLPEKLQKFSPRSSWSAADERVFSSPGMDRERPTTVSLFEEVAEFEKERIIQALSQSNGIKLRAAKLLGVPEATLRNKMKKYGIRTSAIFS
jgi:two-component system response regulator HydG